MSPAATARIDELDGAPTAAGSPRSCRLQTALENSRKDQTYNTPAVATLLLLADQVEWMLGLGGLDACVERCRASSSHLYGWAEARRLRLALRRRPCQALAGRRHDRFRRRGRCGRDRGDPARQRASSTPSRIASSAAISCGSGCSRRSSRPMSRRSRHASIGSSRTRTAVNAIARAGDEGPRQGEDRRRGRRAAARATSTSSSGSNGTPASSRERIGEFDAILIRSATKMTAGADRARRSAQGDRPRRHRRRQRRYRGRHQARNHRRQRARVELDRGRRAHAGAGAGAVPKRAPGARLARRAASGRARATAATSSMARRLA